MRRPSSKIGALPVSEQRALNVRGARARHAVQRLRLRVRLIELHRVARADVEGIPVDHGALATLIDGHRVAVLRDRRLTGRDLAARRQCLRAAHAGLHRQDGDSEGRQRRDDANDAACRCYLSRRAFAGRFALACNVFRYRDQHAEAFTEDTTKPILVHERDRK